MVPPTHLPAPPVIADDWALFLDVDGTLLEFAATPEGVQVPPGLVARLAGVQRHLGGALGLVSGRRLAQLDELFAPLRLRGLTLDLEGQYFEDFVRLGPAPAFVDGGGFDGQTTRRFAERWPDYRRVYYVEATVEGGRRLRSMASFDGIWRTLYSDLPLGVTFAGGAFAVTATLGGPVRRFSVGVESEQPQAGPVGPHDMQPQRILERFAPGEHECGAVRGPGGRLARDARPA